jgi:hypothetical protein
VHKPVAVPPSPTPEAEIGGLVREMGEAYARMVKFYREQLQLSPTEASARASEPADDAELERALTWPPDQVSWMMMSSLAQRDPRAAFAAWERVKAAARQELDSGHRAAAALEGYAGRPWERARFFAIRAGFREEWRPRGGIEDALIDTMAQAHSMYLAWMERLNARASTDAQSEEYSLRQDGTWQPPRVHAAEALDQAAAMSDRFHRLFLRTLRALRDLRRYGPAVIVQSAGQINVGAQQMNVAGGNGSE